MRRIFRSQRAMIVSASRRTDIPAFYGEWLMNRLEAGYCTVVNPYNRNQRRRVSLRAEDVECIVFWTRYAGTLADRLPELEKAGYRSYFLYTLVDYSKRLDEHSPDLDERLRMISKVAAAVPGRVVWRYDPIIVNGELDASYHLERFAKIADALHGSVSGVVISFLDTYGKMSRRMGTELPTDGDVSAALPILIPGLVDIAGSHGMSIRSCAEVRDLRPYGVDPGACVDPGLIARLFGITVSASKDTGQRAACGCAKSVDIGAYDTCVFGCRYCYATSDHAAALANRGRHDPRAESLSQ